jgi:8-oxo-dGTP pyrophosphatase MutT (NUDIX family)
VKDNKEKDVYRLRQRRLACENIRFEIFLDDVENPNGEIVHDYLVVAPKIKTGDLITGVAVLPVVDGKLGLLRIYRHPIQRYLWEVPRGFVDPGESDHSSALRELEEETGLSCADADLESLGIFAPEPGILAARARLFVARNCRVVKPFGGEEFGHKEFRLFESAQVPALHDAGEIQDPATLIACFLYRDRTIPV